MYDTASLEMVARETGCYCDSRYGGIPQLCANPPDDAGMRFIEEFRYNACFISVGKPHSEKQIIGTAFFLHEPYSVAPDNSHVFVITAKHIIQGCLVAGYSYSDIYLRINRRDGGFEHYPLNTKWIFPPENERWDIDVAVALVPIPLAVYAYFPIPLELCAAFEQIFTHYIGPGDELNILGLFKKRYGIRRNIPVVRSGIISAMPFEEEIPFTVEIEEDGKKVEEVKHYKAYLAEIRSIKGLSGSPVYVWIPPGRRLRDVETGQLTDQYTTGYEMYILGLIRSHYDVEAFEPVIDHIDGEDDDEEDLAVNTGIATVTPIWEALALINGDEMKRQKQAKEAAHIRQNSETKDSIRPKPPEPELTQSGFEDALKRASPAKNLAAPLKSISA